MRALWRRRALLLLAGLVLLSGFLAQLAAGEKRSEGFLDSRGDSPNGALALYRWLDGLGYRVERNRPAGDLAPADVLFLLSPVRSPDLRESRALLSWVERGGVLVYHPAAVNPIAQVSGPPGTGQEALSQELGLRVEVSGQVEGRPAFPFFTAPPASRFELSGQGVTLRLEEPEWTPLVAPITQRARPAVHAAVRKLGAGWVYAVADPAFFTNESIGRADNAALVLNVLARHRPASVVFDEDHRTQLRTPDLLGAMRTEPWGWGVIYASAMTFAFVVWGGRRFGPAVVPEREPARSAGDYVTAFAGLIQRARATEWTQRQLAGLFHRRIARWLGAPAGRSRQELARLYAQRWPDRGERLAESLARLETARLSEKRLLQEVRTLEELLQAERKDPNS